MKLNKEICKRCVNESPVYPDTPNLFYWNISDDERWDIGKVFCPRVYMENHFRIDYSTISIYDIPGVCCYKLEHMVMNEA